MSRTINPIPPSTSPRVQTAPEEIAIDSSCLLAYNGTPQPQAYTTPSGLISTGLGPPPPTGAPVGSPPTVNTSPATPPVEPSPESVQDVRALRSFLEESARQMNLELVPRG